MTYKHSSAEKADIAKRFTILRTQVGSGVHGVSIDDQDDRDEMGICVEPAEYVVGLRRFEQYEYRTQPFGHRSGPGDLDLIVYSLRKWMRLALQGNPTVLLPLFVPDTEVVEIDRHGRYLRAHPELVLSRQAGERFVGYLRSQRDQLLGLKGRKHTNRPELVERFGFDTKFAYHMVRLGVQGVELLTDAHVTLPMPDEWRTWLRELRRGEHTKEEALAAADDLEARLLTLLDTSHLPPKPDHTAADAWLIDVYRSTWDS
ncbi:nucleotidyltransferase domain-containing protein [Actinophytocola gossypii]|uniref:Nucleotidyltransferase domain-containing protein n=1 Tax=Actinophytocola gossypii TaxID=2812003 RepID=A0ABT2J3V5_9PSEU|nr:nucleotidyltransferase domain-containing protein [Actinophytocola gossypii]MCT2582356.1 nucleotidyltransferase domain-containing protein [Actinophytocola gossypii]